MPASGGMLATPEDFRVNEGLPPGCFLIYRCGLRVFFIELVRFQTGTGTLLRYDDGDQSPQVTIDHGYFTGFVAEMNRLPVVQGRDWQASLHGDLTQAEAIQVLESLNPPGQTADYRQPYQTGLFVVWAMVGAFAIVACIAIGGRLRGRGRSREPVGTGEWLVLLGVSLVILGLVLPWYVFRDNGATASVLAGWKNLFGVTAAASAIAAAAIVLSCVTWDAIRACIAMIAVVAGLGLLAATLIVVGSVESPLAMAGGAGIARLTGPTIAMAGTALIVGGAALAWRETRREALAG